MGSPRQPQRRQDGDRLGRLQHHRVGGECGLISRDEVVLQQTIAVNAVSVGCQDVTEMEVAEEQAKQEEQILKYDTHIRMCTGRTPPSYQHSNRNGNIQAAESNMRQMITALGRFTQTRRLSPTEQTDAVGLRWTSPKVGVPDKSERCAEECMQADRPERERKSNSEEERCTQI